VAEWTDTQSPPLKHELEYWTIIFNGSLQLQGVGQGILVTSPNGESFKYILQMHFLESNNVFEYEALLHGLWITTTLGIRQLKLL
jgi:ribonuclease HI